MFRQLRILKKRNLNMFLRHISFLPWPFTSCFLRRRCASFITYANTRAQYLFGIPWSFLSSDESLSVFNFVRLTSQWISLYALSFDIPTCATRSTRHAFTPFLYHGDYMNLLNPIISADIYIYKVIWKLILPRTMS